MKKFILFIVVAFLTFGANATELTEARKAVESVKQLCKEVKKQRITVYVADSVDTDALTFKINDGANVQVLKFEKLPEPEKEWYEKT